MSYFEDTPCHESGSVGQRISGEGLKVPSLVINGSMVAWLHGCMVAWMHGCMGCWGDMVLKKNY